MLEARVATGSGGPRCECAIAAFPARSRPPPRPPIPRHGRRGRVATSPVAALHPRPDAPPASAFASPSAIGSSCAASAAAVASSWPPRIRTASRRSVQSSTRRPARPRACRSRSRKTKIDAPRRGRSRVGSDPAAGGRVAAARARESRPALRVAAAASGSRPRQSGFPAGRASGMTPGRRRRHASARWPSPRSRPRFVLSRSCRRVGVLASTPASTARAAQPGRGARRHAARWGYSTAVIEPLLVRAARREQVERTPVWFMRQAGRSLPEYRAIRERHAFFEIANTPELCAEVTLQPVRRHDVDAAVMFADIITPVLGMGVDIRLVDGVGPVIDEPIRTLRDVEKLPQPGSRASFEPCARGGADRAPGPSPRPGGRRFLRRPVHRSPAT